MASLSKRSIDLKKEVISIDLGSNTLRVLKFDCSSKKRVAEFEQIVKTAKDLDQTGKIEDDTIQKILEAITQAKKVIKFDAKDAIAVTTEALRRAKNSDEVLNRIWEETGVRFHLISGYEEAIFTLKAVITRLLSLNIDAKSLVLVDIGGGSTEIIFRFEDKILVKSFPVGIVSIANRYKNLQKMEKGLEKEMQPIRDFINLKQKPKVFVATAGTPTTIASIKMGMDYKSYNPDKINGVTLSIDEVKETLNMLLGIDEVKRDKLVGIGREDLIVAGVLIFEKLFEILGFKEAIIIDDGLREGVALNLCSRDN